MIDIQMLDEALEGAKDVCLNEGSCDTDHLEMIYEAARQYLAILPEITLMIEAREKATQGEWIYKDQDGRVAQQIACIEEIVSEFSPHEKLATLSVTAWKPERAKSAKPNAKFIATAANAISRIKGKLG